MRVLLFGATGMVGQGVLRECLRSDLVSEVVAPVRQSLGQSEPKLREIVGAGPEAWARRAGGYTGFDACFFCIGVSSLGMSEAAYRDVTHDLTLAIAEPVLQASPQAVFVYVSGANTDANGRAMWARVKGETENALLAMPFRAVYLFRPGYIQPLGGIRSKTGWYAAMYRGMGWLYPALRRWTPKWVTSTEAVGRAMIAVARNGWSNAVLETEEINRAAESIKEPHHEDGALV